MSGAPDLVVHVGLGAAGTLLASALPLLEGELARQGVRVAAPADAPSVGGAPLLVCAPARPAPADPSDLTPFCTLPLDEVAALVERTGARRARVVLSPERQDRLLERSYRAAVAEGCADEFVVRYPRWREPLLDYRPLAARLRGLPGVLDLRVLPIELVGAGPVAFVGALLGTLACARPVDLRPLASWPVPQEYSPRGMRIARAMAPHLDTEHERLVVRAYLLDTYAVSAGASPQLWSQERRSVVVRAYRAANREFFSEYAPELPPASYGNAAGLDALGSALTPVEVQSSAGGPGRSPFGVRAQLARLRRRLPA